VSQNEKDSNCHRKSYLGLLGVERKRRQQRTNYQPSESLAAEKEEERCERKHRGHHLRMTAKRVEQERRDEEKERGNRKAFTCRRVISARQKINSSHDRECRRRGDKLRGKEAKANELEKEGGSSVVSRRIQREHVRWRVDPAVQRLPTAKPPRHVQNLRFRIVGRKARAERHVTPEHKRN